MIYRQYSRTAELLLWILRLNAIVERTQNAPLPMMTANLSLSSSLWLNKTLLGEIDKNVRFKNRKNEEKKRMIFEKY